MNTFTISDRTYHKIYDIATGAWRKEHACDLAYTSQYATKKGRLLRDGAGNVYAFEDEKVRKFCVDSQTWIQLADAPRSFEECFFVRAQTSEIDLVQQECADV